MLLTFPEGAKHTTHTEMYLNLFDWYDKLYKLLQSIKVDVEHSTLHIQMHDIYNDLKCLLLHSVYFHSVFFKTGYLNMTFDVRFFF